MMSFKSPGCRFLFLDPNNSSKSQVKANLILQVIPYDIQKRNLKSKVPVDNVVFLITFASYLLTPSMETLK